MWLARVKVALLLSYASRELNCIADLTWEARKMGRSQKRKEGDEGCLYLGFERFPFIWKCGWFNRVPDGLIGCRVDYSGGWFMNVCTSKRECF